MALVDVPPATVPKGSGQTTCRRWFVHWVFAAFRSGFPILLLLFASACTSSTPQTGILEGHVAIGPLVPVLREGEPQPTPAPEAYTAREIVIFSRDGRTEVARAAISADGHYRIVLPVGTYLVDINHVGIDTGVDLPRLVEIISQRTVRLDVEIDTGIR
jgi:hypothetical protein